MTTTLSEKGVLVIPSAIRKQLHLKRGDQFEVSIHKENVITLRCISKPANAGLVQQLLSCPFSFDIPPREKKIHKEI